MKPKNLRSKFFATLSMTIDSDIHSLGSDISFKERNKIAGNLFEPIYRSTLHNILFQLLLKGCYGK